MSLLEDLTASAPIIEKEVEFRGHQVKVRTVIGMDAFPYYSAVNDLQLGDSPLYGQTMVAAVIAASMFTMGNEHIFPSQSDVIEAIRDHWSEKEIRKIYGLCVDVGNGNDIDKEKKE